MASTHPILADVSAGISELKKNPMSVVEQGEGAPVAILNRNEPVFYAVPAEADVDQELNQRATVKLDAIENAFARAFERAQQEGQLDTRRTAQELASMVMTINLGLRVKSRQNLSSQELKTTFENSLSMLGLVA